MQNINKKVRKLGCESPELQERHRSPVVKTNDDHSFSDMSHDSRNSHPIICNWNGVFTLKSWSFLQYFAPIGYR
jgi:hypothetical protein